MTQPSAPQSNVEATARWMAGARAVERSRPDALFDDPFAAALAGPEGIEWATQRTPAGLAPMLIRTRYFDDWLKGLMGAGPRQVVLLAAGLDTRAYRLAWPSDTVLYELDRPEFLEEKEARLREAGARPACQRRAVGGDLLGGWVEPLLAAGLDTHRPVTWLLEGILFYLPSATVLRTAEEVSRLSAPESRLGFDVVNSVTMSSPLTRPWLELQARAGAPWLSWLDDPKGSLEALGWTVAVSQPGSPEAHFGRWPYPAIPVSAHGVPRHWLVTAVRGLGGTAAH